MPKYILEKYIDNNIATHKEIEEFELNQKKARRAAISTTVSLGLASSIISSNVASKFSKQEVAIEQISTETKTEVNLKSETVAAPQVQVKSMFASLPEEEEKEISNSMTLPVDSKMIVNVKEPVDKEGSFEPNITYYADKGAKATAPDAGKIVKVKEKEKSLTIEHKKGEKTYYTTMNGVIIKPDEIKVNDSVDKGEALGSIYGGVLKLSVSKDINEKGSNEFIQPEILIDTDIKPKETKTTKAAPEPKVEVAKTNQASKSEEKKVEELPHGDLIVEAAEKHDVDPVLVAGLVKQESSFDTNATSKSGAMGLMQLMPDTAEWLGVEDAYDPEENIDAGVGYLKSLIDKYGDPELALYAYNGGPGNVDTWLKEGLTPEEFPWTETKEYGTKVLNNLQNIKGETKPKEVVQEKAKTVDPYQEKINSIPNEYKKPINFGDFSGKLKGVKVGIDAGHYPKAPGAVSHDRKTTELEINREIKELVISDLKEAGAIIVDSNGDTQSLLPGQRAKVFDSNEVDFALSIHNNSAENKAASGTETLFEQGIPESQELAQSIQTNIAKAIPTIEDRKIKARNNLGIFTEGETITALVETGFMSNPYDMELLRNDVVKENISNAIVKGFIDYAEANNIKVEEETKENKKEVSKDESDKKVKTKDDSEKSKEKKSKDKESEKTKVEKEKSPEKDEKNNVSNSTEKDEKEQDSKDNKVEEEKSPEKDEIGKVSEPTDENTKEQPVEQEQSPEKDEIEVSEPTTNEQDTKKQETEEAKDDANKKEVEPSKEETSEEEHSFIFSKFFR